MPWTIKDVSRHNKKVARSKKASKLWCKVANKHLEKTGDEGEAIRIANYVADRVVQANTMDEILIRKKLADKRANGKPKQQLREARTKINFSGNMDIQLAPRRVNVTYSPDKNTTMLYGVKASFEKGRKTMSSLQEKIGNLRNETVEARSHKPTTSVARARLHKRLHAYHTKEIKHHGMKIMWLKEKIEENPQNTEWNKDYHTAIAKHEAFKKYHEGRKEFHKKSLHHHH